MPSTEDRTRWRVFGLTWLAYASYYLTRKNFSVAKKSMQADLGISTGQLAWIDTGYLTAYAAGMFLWGAMADRVGYKRVILAGMLATIACSLWFSASSAVILFALAFGVNGLAQSTGWPSNVKAMASWFPARRRAAIMGVWTTNYQVGGLAANPVATVLLVGIGWRAAFYWPAAIVGAVLLLLVLALPARGPIADAPDVKARPPAEARREVLRKPLLWALGSAYFFMKLTRYVLLFWLPFYMESVLEYSKAMAGNVPLAFEAGGSIGALTVGWISDRMGSRRTPVAVAALFGLAGALVLYGHLAPLGVGWNIAALALVGFCLFGPDALVSGAAAQDLGGPAAAGTAAGIINGMGSVGPIFSSHLAAWVGPTFGWKALYAVLGVGALVSASILIPFWRTRRDGTTDRAAPPAPAPSRDAAGR